MFTHPPKLHTSPRCVTRAGFVLCATLVFQCACLHSSDYFLRRGKELFAKGNYSEACLNFRKAAQEDERSAEAYFRLGTCEYIVKQKDDALAALIEAHHLDGQRSDILAQLADVTFARYLESGKSQKLYRSVQSLVDELLAANPESVTGLRLRGDLLLAIGKVGDAVPDFEEANRLQPGDAATALPLADTLWRQGRGAKAEEIAQEALKNNPHFGPLYLWLNHFYSSNGQEARAEGTLADYARNNSADLNAIATFAVDRLEHQQFAAAKPYLQAALKNPSMPDRFTLIGDLFRDCGDAEDAKGAYRAGLESDPTHKVLYRLRLAKLYMAENHLAEALNMIGENLREDPANVDSAVLRISILETTGRQRLASAEAKKLLSEHPNDPRAGALLGELYYGSGDLDAARTLFLKALKKDARNAEALSGMAALSRDSHDYPQMLSYARQLAAVRPADPFARLLLAAAFARTGDAVHAEKELKLLSAIPAVAGQSTVELARLYIAGGDGQSAISLLRPICLSSNAGQPILQTLASAYLAAGQTDAGLKFFSALIPSRQEDGTTVRYLVAQLAERAGKDSLAEQQYSVLINNHPNAPAFLMAMGLLFEKQGQTRRAIPYLERAATLAPGDPGLAASMAQAYQSAGESENAIRAYARAVSLGTGDPVVLNNYAYVLASSGGNARQAIALAKSALATEPDNPDLSDTLAFAYLKAGDHAAAFNILDLLVRRFPERAAFRYHLALALSADGKGRAARQHLIAGLADHPSREEERDIRKLLTKIGS